MTEDYSVELCRRLQQGFESLGLHRPMRVSRYDDGAELICDVTGVVDSTSSPQVGSTSSPQEDEKTAQVRLVVERFVGGGFAGQVYRVRTLDINPPGAAAGLTVGQVYAMKILVPPSEAKKIFRNLLYAVGFQGPFQLQVNPAAIRAAALWQKFIRRAAKIRFGDEKTVTDIYATFIDRNIGSCGELSEWIDGRTWRLEVDDRLDLLSRWLAGDSIDETKLGSAEYRAKRKFMADFVRMLHEIGADELARQYEWATCKSQPNLLKRMDTKDNPEAGLTAVDFRAGLALLPFGPMSPADFKLIAKGIARGSLVQFDRGNIAKLQGFVDAHSNEFADMRGMLDRLKQAERVYRDSLPDVTHNHIRLLYSARLWSTIFDSAVTGWRIRNLVDDEYEKKLRSSRILTLLFFLVGLIPVLGKIVRRIWARCDWRKHYASMLTSVDYLRRAVNGRIIEKAVGWHRAGRISELQTIRIAQQPWRFFYHLPFLLLIFPGLHRFLTDSEYRKEKLVFIFVRPFRLYFHAHLREQWLREMVAEGQKKHILTEEDADVIIRQIDEPYIQKYLVSLVVHLMTLPVSEIVISLVTAVYVLTRPELTWEQAWKTAGTIFVVWQAIPISPGSLVRGFYVVALMIKERDFKNYNIAVSLAFFRVIGYLAFPIQMTYRYPALARFMAAHWATEIVHSVPVFGEQGALLEHWTFRLFYNWPLTIRRRMRRRAELRAQRKPRYWAIVLCALVGAAISASADRIYLSEFNELPGVAGFWPIALLVPLVCGFVLTLSAGGLALWKRIVSAALCGIAAAIISVAFSVFTAQQPITPGLYLAAAAWRAFAFAAFSAILAVITELKLPDPDSH